jgi:hypothetical protein
MIQKPITKLMILAVCCAMAIMTVAPSSAAIISDVIFQIDAEGPGGNMASFEVPLTSGSINGDMLSWSLSEPMSLMDKQGNEVGLLENASVLYVADPVVVLNFLVSSAGGGNFTVTSANLSFAAIANATGRASAAVTVTDSLGDGADISGGFPVNDTYRAFYNDPGNVSATGTTFATLTPGISSSAFSSATSNEGFPDNAGGFSSTDENGGAISPVSSMSAQWSFSISAGDSASGTSTYIIVPEPGSCLLCLCGMAVLGIIRRR